MAFPQTPETFYLNNGGNYGVAKPKFKNSKI
jgi:hypothetical protein